MHDDMKGRHNPSEDSTTRSGGPDGSPRPAEDEKSSVRCPQCGFQYGFDGQRCNHCGHGGGEPGNPLIQLLQTAHNLDPLCIRERENAIKALGDSGDPRAVGPLIGILQQPGFLRKDAAGALGKLKLIEAITPLVDVLTDPDENLRSTAAWALGMIGAQHAGTGPIELADGPNEDARQAVAQDQRELAYHKAIEALVALARDEFPTVAEEACRALGRIGDERAKPVLTDLSMHPIAHVRTAALRALTQFKAIDPLLQAVQDADSSVREAAAVGLGKIGDPCGWDRLTPLLQDPQARVRAATIRALTRLDGAQAIGLLTGSLQDTEVTVQLVAIEELLKLGHAEITPAVEELMLRGDDRTFTVCAKALSTIGDERAVGPLVRALERSDWGKRKVAAKAIVALVRRNRSCLGDDAQRIASLVRTEHQDTHTDHGLPTCAGFGGREHTDHHEDTGVGVPFPLLPNRRMSKGDSETDF